MSKYRDHGQCVGQLLGLHCSMGGAPLVVNILMTDESLVTRVEGGAANQQGTPQPSLLC